MKIKRFDTTIPLPAYQTEGSVGFDLYARIDTIIPPFIPTIIPMNIAVKIPKGHMLMLASRSSTPIKKGLMVANGIGIVDEDYCGDNDEIGLIVLNFTQKPVTVEKGERIGQALLVKVTKIDSFEEVNQLQEKDRGGFGSTGTS